MYFCGDNGELLMLEVMMRQVPGFQPRRSGIRVSQGLTMDEVFGKDGKEEMKLRMERYEVPERIQKDVVDRDGEEKLFLDKAHRERFMSALGGTGKELMMRNGRFLAAVFLLSSDKLLWEKTRHQVTELGIMFDDGATKEADEARRVLYLSAKEIYVGANCISLEEVSDAKVSNEILTTIISAYLLRVAGANLTRRSEK